MTDPQRQCPFCDARESIRAGERVWPLNWKCPACGNQVAQAKGMQAFAPALADTVSGFDPVSYGALARVEATNFWFVSRNELIVALAQRFFPNARRYLEIGCGNGAVLQALTHSRQWDRVVGTDLHPAGLAHARSRLPAHVELAQVDATAIPAVAAFDLTGAFDIVEHVADDEAVLAGLRQATVKGGGAIIAVPQHPWLWSRADEIGHHQRRYRRGEMEVKLVRNGYKVLFSSSFTATLLPLMAASRLSSKFARDDRHIQRETNLGPFANAMLTAILRAEVRLTLAGLRWPAGGSRIVVAQAV